MEHTINHTTEHPIQSNRKDEDEGISGGSSDRTFFEMFRKKGFYNALALLTIEPVSRTAFFTTIKTEGYLNEFYRVEQDLLTHKLIGYSCTPEGEIKIALTEKGLTLRKKIEDIEAMLTSP